MKSVPLLFGTLAYTVGLFNGLWGIDEDYSWYWDIALLVTAGVSFGLAAWACDVFLSHKPWRRA